jgi:hypothetical protein
MSAQAENTNFQKLFLSWGCLFKKKKKLLTYRRQWDPREWWRGVLLPSSGSGPGKSSSQGLCRGDKTDQKGGGMAQGWQGLCRGDKFNLKEGVAQSWQGLCRGDKFNLKGGGWHRADRGSAGATRLIRKGGCDTRADRGSAGATRLIRKGGDDTRVDRGSAGATRLIRKGGVMAQSWQGLCRGDKPDQEGGRGDTQADRGSAGATSPIRKGGGDTRADIGSAGATSPIRRGGGWHTSWQGSAGATSPIRKREWVTRKLTGLIQIIERDIFVAKAMTLQAKKQKL